MNVPCLLKEFKFHTKVLALLFYQSAFKINYDLFSLV